MQWRRWALVAVVVLLGVWVVVALATAVRAGLDLREGRRAAKLARHQDVVAVAEGRVLGQLAHSRSRFRSAHGRLGSPVLAPIRVLPYFGRQLDSVHTLSAAGADVAGVGIDSVQRARSILALPHQTGPDRVAQLRALSALATQTQARLTPVRFGPSHNLVGPVARGHDEIVKEVDDVRAGLNRAAAGATAVADLLTGPRNYIVFAANNAEMRAGSGMFLSIGTLVTGGGDLHMTGTSSVADVPVPPGVPIPDADYNARWGWLMPQTEWRNLMLSPRLEASATLASSMWTAAGRPPVDGVVTLDPVALQAILQATGPVTVNGRSVGAKKVIPELLHDQYVRFNSPDQRQRREELSVIATEAVAALQSGAWSPARLAQGLAEAGRGRHILAWSTRPAEESAWSAAGIGGALRPDSLAVSVINRGGNKLDQYLHVRSDLGFQHTGARTTGVLRVTVTNASPTGDPSYIAGPNAPGLEEGEYLGIVAVNLPGPASNGRIDGVSQLVVAGGDGPTRVVGTFVQLPRGQQKTVVVRFELPVDHGELHVEPAARVPAMQWNAGGQRWTDKGARTVAF
jgi:hypothetical protein